MLSKRIAEFRRIHRDAVTAAGAELVRFARICGLIPGEWIAIDGSKFRAVASIDNTRERLALQRYLYSIEKADDEQQASIEPSSVQAALEKLKRHPEPESGFMLVRQTALPAYNVQTAVDAEHTLIVAHAAHSEQPGRWHTVRGVRTFGMNPIPIPISVPATRGCYDNGRST